MAALAACGGGGSSEGTSDSGNSGSSGGTAPSGAFSVNSTSFNFTAPRNGDVPDDQTLTVSWSSSDIAGFAFVFEDESQLPTWISYDSIIDTQSPANVAIGVNTTALQPGTYTATLPFHAGDIDYNSLGNVDIAITYTVTEPETVPPTLDLSTNTLSFTGINGANLPAQQLQITMSDDSAAAWTAITDQDWLIISATSGTSPTTLTVWADPSLAPLASGNYQGEIVINSGEIEQSVAVNLSLIPATLTAQESILFGGNDGLDDSITADFPFSINSGSTQYSWSLELSEDWLSTDQSSGLVNDTGTIETLILDPSSLPAGSHTASATLSVSINGDTLTAEVPVTYNKETRAIFVADNGIGLVSLPSYQDLRQSLEVKDTTGRLTNWTAVSNQPWLSVTASGTTDDQLVLMADASVLVPDQVYVAQVTISSSNPEIENTETVQVGLWYGSTDPEFSEDIAATNFSELVADPIRPYVYAHNKEENISVYNVYTGSLVHTISLGDFDIATGDMTISSDGRTLYVVNSDTSTITTVDLNTYTSENIGTSISGSSIIEYARFSARDYVLTQDGSIYTADLTQLDPLTVANGMPAVNRDGTRLCYLRHNISPHSIYCAPVRYSALGGGGLQTVSPMTSYRGIGTARDIAMNSSGEQVFVAVSGGGYDFVHYQYDGSSINLSEPLSAVAYPMNVEVSNNDILYGAASVSSGGTDFWVYDWTTGSELGSDDLSIGSDRIETRQMALSPDNQRVILLVGTTNNFQILIRQAGFTLH